MEYTVRQLLSLYTAAATRSDILHVMYNLRQIMYTRHIWFDTALKCY